MFPGQEPVECLLHAVEGALAPLESGFLFTVKSLESSWPNSRSDGKTVELSGRYHRSGRRKPEADLVVAVVPAEERKKGPIKSFLGVMVATSSSSGGRKGDLSKKRPIEDQEGDGCNNCMQFAYTWSHLATSLAQALPSPLKSVKKCFGNQGGDQEPVLDYLGEKPTKSEACNRIFWAKSAQSLSGDGEMLSPILVLCFALENLAKSLHIIKKSCQKDSFRSNAKPEVCGSSAPPHFDHLKIIKSLINGKKADSDGFLSSLGFARVGGVPESLVDTTTPVANEVEDYPSNSDKEEPEGSSAQRIASGILNIPLSNVERLKSTLSTVSLPELIEFLPQLGKSSADHPDKKKLFSVQEFFRYAEVEGRRFFEELDRDGDGQVNLEDLEVAIRKRKLPRRYAKDFFRRTRSNMFSKSIGWKQFLTLMEQKEPTMLRAYTTLCLSKSGTLQKSQLLTSLRSAGLPASEDNAIAMMRYLNADNEGSISYSHFRNFMLLLPLERLEEDPRSIWFEAATVVAVPPPVEISAENVMKSALAGGLASALSTSLLHPIDTMKTRVQASSISFPELISKLPEIGLQGLYRGSIPAILGQFSSHGLRTGIFEASKLVLIKVAPSLREIQVQSMASFCSTILGTAVRIPCEVLKQRLQAGLFDNVGEAIVGTFEKDGVKGFFRGTGAALCREVPFYVAGMCLYAEAKKAAQNLLNRGLEPWETIAVGALSGGLAAVFTTPFDVMKTRMMTAPQGFTSVNADGGILYPAEGRSIRSL